MCHLLQTIQLALGNIQTLKEMTDCLHIIKKYFILYEVYNISNIREFDKQVFYPGEIILEDIFINQPSLFCFDKKQSYLEMKEL